MGKKKQAREKQTRVDRNVRKKNNKVKRRMYAEMLILFVVLVVCIASASGYFVQIYQKVHEKKKLEVKVSELKEKQDILQSEVFKLQDSDYVGRYAREKYLYSKDGEFIIRMPEK